MSDDYRQQRLAEARQAEEQARMEVDRDWGSSRARMKWASAVHQREMAMYLAHDCYGAYGKCISCGCTKGKPCVSHQGAPKHQAELLERIAIATEGKP